MATQQQMDSDLPRALLADLSAGLVVFLVALPLCLGIALASNAPLFSGVLAGIVGGLLVGAISGSHTSVSGPAAGLTAVVAVQIAALGSFDAFLLAVLIAGALQVGLGVIRAGSIAVFVPSSVIKGLLAAIGLILILKQTPYLFGHDAGLFGEMSFLKPDRSNTFSELVEILWDFHPGAALVGVVCITLLVFSKRIKWLEKSGVPAPLIVVLVGVGTHMALQHVGGRWVINETYLVQVPVAETITEFFGFLQLPDFAAIGNTQVYVAAITIALVATLETLLNVEAVDKLDPRKRVSPPNRELVAQGVGNMACGLIGGLPVTSVIVRSSVNITSGGRTKLAAIVHGMLLLLSVMFIPMWLNAIPLSSLAAVLIVTGFKLAKPSLFRQMWREGPNQFLPFVVTVFAILLTDLLIGILIGLGFSTVFILRSNLRRPVRQIVERHVGGEVLRLELASQVSFLNRAALLKALDSVPRGGHVLIDARGTDYVDADVHDLIWEYVHEIAPARGVQVSMMGLKDHYEQLRDRLQYVDYTTREVQSQLTPERVLQILREGNARFRQGEQLTRDLARQLEVTSKSQHPLAVVFSGASSRTPVEMIFDVGLGDLFCVRVTGNLVRRGVLGSLEYACIIAGAKAIVVMGHSNSELCRMALESAHTGENAAEKIGCENLQPIIAEVQQSLRAEDVRQWPNLDEAAQTACADRLYRDHIVRTIGKIREGSSILDQLATQGQIHIVGAMYSVRTGEVEFLA